MGGDIRDNLGLRGDAHTLWSQALMLAEQECQALGLKERQVGCPINHCHTRLHAAHTCFHKDHCTIVHNNTSCIAGHVRREALPVCNWHGPVY